MTRTLTTERKQFEEWFTNKYPRSYWGVEKTASGEYQGGLAAPLWEAWQESSRALANREARPVGRAEITKIAAELVRGDYLSKLWTEAEKSRHVDTHRLQNLLDELHDVMKVKAIAITRLLTTPPAPAAPGIDELRLTFERSERESDDGFNLHKYGIGYADESTQARWESWLACRSAMLAQPVSSGYKLVPAEPTEDMIAAAMNCDDVSFNADETFCVNFGNIYAAMLAAAPEGGNG